MCGIVGLHSVFSKSGQQSTDLEPCLNRMLEAISHRGPDDRGTIFLKGQNSSVNLGNTRLAIIDLSPEGHQPMMDSGTGNWITYNGEIYNHVELRNELRNFSPFVSRSDTEVVLKAYARWGRDCLSRLQGMFAFAIW